MDYNSSGRNQLPATSHRKLPVRGRMTSKQEQQEKHTSHRTQRVKIRGLILDPPNGNGPIEVCVNYQADWELIYKNPRILVKCLVESCETLLTAKRMSKSGLRFLAARSGNCSHNLVEMQVEHGEVEQDPSNLVGGGGPEGHEHLWMKGRLLKIAQRLGAKAVVEHTPTRADVFLPEHGIALEYQRWDTNFAQRTRQRSAAGAADTIWMFPWQPTGAPQTQAHKAFNTEVFKHGGIYVAVRNKDNPRELQRPWEDSSLERTARLYASGSIVVFDPAFGALVRRSLSLATVLAQIISGDRILATTTVLRKNDGRKVQARVWAQRDDLARVESLQTKRRRDATLATCTTSSLTPKPDLDADRPTVTENQPQNGTPVVLKTVDDQGPELGIAVPTAETPTEVVDFDPGLPATTARADLDPDTGSDPREVAPLTNANPMSLQPKTPAPTPRRSLWNIVADWFRSM